MFIDETWTKTNITRLRGWAPKGERLVDKVPQGKWKTATFLAALRNDRIDAPCLFDGPINGERFRAYVEQFLVPTLKPGDAVILDNLVSHKGKEVRKAIRAVGARLVFLPKYSPDLNPSKAFRICRAIPRPRAASSTHIRFISAQPSWRTTAPVATAFPSASRATRKTHLGPSEGVQRKMVITFWRIEAGRERFPMTQKLNDIMLSWIFLSDDQSGASRARV